MLRGWFVRVSGNLRSQLRDAALWLCLLGLNWLLFLPSYGFSQPRADFFPFFPKRHLHGIYRWDLSSAQQYLLSLILRRDNLDVFRVSVEVVLVALLLIWTARVRKAASVRAVLVAAYLLLLVFLAYHHAIRFFFARNAALGSDYRLLTNLIDFLWTMQRSALLIGAVCVLSIALVGMLARWTFRSMQLTAAKWSAAKRARVSAVLGLPCIAVLTWFGVQRDDTVVQVTSKRMVENYRASRAEAALMQQFTGASPDRRYDAFSRLTLQRKPNVYLFMIEAYGEILSSWDMTAAYRALLDRVSLRLSAAGYHARSAYSAAPVHGGTSWLSIATVHSGILIDQPVAYAALQNVAARVPSITRFFREQGYRSYALQPGTNDHSAAHEGDMFHHDVALPANLIGYLGPRYGWGRIPDQYSLGVLRERYLAHAPEPHYTFFMSVSTHFPWGEGVPTYVHDWKTLDVARAAPLASDPDWPSFPQAANIATEYRRSYFRSIEYEWRTLTELLTAESSRDIVVLIVGDHQPRLESNAPVPITMNTPVHVLSRDATFVESFAAQGFQAGLYADPTLHPALQHAGLFSLLISKLAAAYGAAGSRNAPYFPSGIHLAGMLNR
jgi:hypothetical protein